PTASRGPSGARTESALQLRTRTHPPGARNSILQSDLPGCRSRVGASGRPAEFLRENSVGLNRFYSCLVEGNPADSPAETPGWPRIAANRKINKNPKETVIL